MIGAGTYILSAALLAAVVVPIGFSAVRIRRRLLPEWEGAPAHLVEAILGVALAIWLAELLGTLQLLYSWALVLASLLVAAGTYALTRADGSQSESAVPPAGGAGCWGGRGRLGPQHPPNAVTGPAGRRLSSP